MIVRVLCVMAIILGCSSILTFDQTGRRPSQRPGEFPHSPQKSITGPVGPQIGSLPGPGTASRSSTNGSMASPLLPGPSFLRKRSRGCAFPLTSMQKPFVRWRMTELGRASS